MDDAPALASLDLPQLVEGALLAPDDRAEWPFLEELSQRDQKLAVAAAKRLLKDGHHRSRAVGAELARALWDFDRGRAAVSAQLVPLLIGLVPEERNREALRRIVGTLGAIGDARAADVVLDLPDDSDSAILEAVALALPSLADATSLDDIVVRLISLATHPEDQVRDWAVYGLAEGLTEDSLEIREALVTRLDDPDVSTRHEAVLGLALRSDPRCIDRLVHDLLDPGITDQVYETGGYDVLLRACVALADHRLRGPLEALQARGVWEVDAEALNDAIRSVTGGDPFLALGFDENGE